MVRRVLPVLLLCALLAAVAAPGSGASASRVPQGFVGMMVDGPTLSGRVDLGRQLDRMVADGVESVRVVFDWRVAQPYASWRDVPLDRAGDFQNTTGDMPTDFADSDRIVGAAVSRGLQVLPVVVYTPGWDADDQGHRIEPRDVSPYAQFMETLVRRYGPNGSFWSQNPSLRRSPIRAWQIWNEPANTFFWDQQPFARSYVALLRAARTAIRNADHGARIVLGGLANYSWRDLDSIYRQPGASRLFDLVAIHPYTSQPKGVITILRYAREVMDRHGDRRKPILATEVGWPSARGATRSALPFDTTQKGQAERLGQLLPLLAAARSSLGLAGFDVYTWMTAEYRNAPAFYFSGLLRFDVHSARVTDKPALSAFRAAALSLERCRVKAASAGVCSRPG